MITPQGISKKLPGNPSLNFKQLREEGIRLVQDLSGKLWTNYNLTDPGVTTLEVLCYALTELGYRADLLKEAFERDEAVAPDFIDRYFFRYDELIPSLPLTRQDFEHFIEENHPKVLSAWVEEYPVLHPRCLIRGGYEVVLLLEPDQRYGNLNTDVIQIGLDQKDIMLEVILFDEENHRMNWKHIKKVTSCYWNEDDPDNFFVFEKSNCQVALTLEAVYQRHNRSEEIHAKARVTLNHPKTRKRSPATRSYQKAIIQKLGSPEFLDAIARNLSKEHYKARLLTDIGRKLLPCRNLCEDFISLRVANEQEVKIDVEIILDDYAPPANTMINKVYDCLDAFLLQLLRQAKLPEQRSRKNILYASNLIEEMVKTEGIEAARILNLNLFIDGVPTIPLKDETSFECIHLQRFSYYVPKISREKSNVVFIRSGAVEKADAASISREFTPRHFFTGKAPAEEPGAKPERKKPEAFDKSFFENLRQYYSIQNDFPQNYRLREGRLSTKAPEKLKIRVRQFKAYLAFFERMVIDYLYKLYIFNDLLSAKQGSEIGENELERLKKELPDLDLLKSSSTSAHSLHNQLIRQNKILDHLLARFATRYAPVTTERWDINMLERIVQAKKQLLRDIPLVTRERGLGLPVKPLEKRIWDSDLLSGFQKRLYRLLGVSNENLRHLRLTKVRGTEPIGFYLVEHILLVRREEDHIFVKRFNRDAEVLQDYISNLSGHHQYDPYSFQLTMVLPDWYPSWRKRRNTVETIIKEEMPAHILPYFLWLNKKNMAVFETLYEDWLKSLLRLYES